MIGDKTILWASLIVSILAYTFWSPIKDYFGVAIFYKGSALAIVGISYVLQRKFKTLITELILTATTNNLIDELFFDPTKFQINEWIFFIISVIIIVYRWRKRLKT